MSFQSTVKNYENRLNTELNKFPALVNLERQTGIPKTYVSTAFVSLYLLFTYLNVGGVGELLANIASVAIPGYFSLVALETAGTADDTQYLTYWVVYASFTIAEFWSSVLVNWIPAYWLFKTLLFLYLGLPSFGGARIVYHSVLRPFGQRFLGTATVPPETAKAAKAE